MEHIKNARERSLGPYIRRMRSLYDELLSSPSSAERNLLFSMRPTWVAARTYNGWLVIDPSSYSFAVVRKDSLTTLGASSLLLSHDSIVDGSADSKKALLNLLYL